MTSFLHFPLECILFFILQTRLSILVPEVLQSYMRVKELKISKAVPAVQLVKRVKMESIAE